MCLFFARCLYDDKEVVLIGCNHHLVLSAGDTQEGEVIWGVQVTDQVPRLSRQLRQFETIVCCLSTLVHGAADEYRLRIVSFLIFSIVNNEQSLDTLVLCDPLDSLVHLAALSGGCWCGGILLGRCCSSSWGSGCLLSLSCLHFLKWFYIVLF